MSKYTFEKANGNGMSQCQKCGVIEWDCFAYKVKEFNNKRVCAECKKHMENGTEHLIEIKWNNFKPKY